MRVTAARIRDLVKQAKAKGEDAKVSVRNVRRRAMEELHRIRKDGEAGEDEAGLLEFSMERQPNSRLSCQIHLSDAMDGLALTVAAAEG